MSLGLGGIAVSFGVPLVLGALLQGALCVSWRGDVLGFLARSLAFGALVVAAVVALLLMGGLSPYIEVLLPMLALTGAALALIAVWRMRVDRPRHAAADRRETGPRPRRARPDVGELLLVCAAIVLCLPLADRAVHASARPLVLGGDGATRDAMSVHQAGGFGDLYRSDLARAAERSAVVTPAYRAPLSVALVVFTFAIADGPTWFEHRLPIVAFAFLLPALFLAATRGRVRWWMRLVFVMSIAGAAPLHLEVAEANSRMAVAVGLLIAVDGWRRWCEGGGARAIAITALGLALCAAAREEGLAVAAAFALAALVGSRRAGASLRTVHATVAWWLVPFAVAFGARMVAERAGAVPVSASHDAFRALVNYPQALREAFERVLLVPQHGRLVPLALVLVALARPRIAGHVTAIVPIAALALGTLLLVWRAAGIAAIGDAALRTAVVRDLWTLVPASTLVFAFLAEDAWRAWRTREE